MGLGHRGVCVNARAPFLRECGRARIPSVPPVILAAWGPDEDAHADVPVDGLGHEPGVGYVVWGGGEAPLH